MKKYKKALIASGLAAALALLLLYALHVPLLNGMAHTLYRHDPLVKADAAVVLAGDRHGERMLTGIKLYKEGYVRKIIFWGGTVYWKYTYAELTLRQLKDFGIPMEDVIWTDRELGENSTRGEAKANLTLCRENGIKSILLVTSPYHTARAGRVYDGMKGDITVNVIPSVDSHIQLDHWWRDRESAKMVYLELNKKLFYYLSG